MDPYSDSSCDDDDSGDIREDLSKATFDELIKMREKVGTKFYKTAVLDKLRNSSESDKPKSVSQSTRASSSQQKEKLKPKPKSAPIEVSSKRVDKGLNFLNILKPHEIKEKVAKFRDPRFDSRVGDCESKFFEQNYGFMSDLRQKEIDQLRKALKKTKDSDEREKIRTAVQRLENQNRSNETKVKEKTFEKVVRDKVQKTVGHNQQQQQPQQSQQPDAKTFVNKSKLKRAQMVEKFKQLKQSGKFNKYIEKKRKKNVVKDRRKISSARKNPDF